MSYDLSFIDLEQKTLQPLDNPFARACHPCLKVRLSPVCPAGQMKSGAGEGIRTLDPNLGKVVLYP